MRAVRWFWVVAAMACVLTAAFHSVAVFVPAISEPSSPARHGLFAFVNAGLSVGFYRRARWLPYVLAPLTVQQYWSHGHDLWSARTGLVPHWDVQSIAVLVAFPLLWLLVALERRASPSAERHGPPN